MFASIVYLLCGFTSLICAVLLFKSYRQTNSRLALWSAVAFALFTVNNFFVIADFIWFPSMNLMLYRLLPLTLGVVVMIFGLIRESV